MSQERGASERGTVDVDRSGLEAERNAEMWEEFPDAPAPEQQAPALSCTCGWAGQGWDQAKRHVLDSLGPHEVTRPREVGERIGMWYRAVAEWAQEYDDVGREMSPSNVWRGPWRAHKMAAVADCRGPRRELAECRIEAGAYTEDADQ